MRDKYIVANANNLEDLQRKVIQLIDAGYITVGGVSSAGFDDGSVIFLQAMETL